MKQKRQKKKGLLSIEVAIEQLKTALEIAREEGDTDEAEDKESESDGEDGEEKSEA